MPRMTRAMPLLFLAIERSMTQLYKMLITALIAGCIAGLVVFALQAIKLTPMILQAETYETASPEDIHHHDGHAHEHTGHVHDEAAWAPENGAERYAYHLLSSLGMGVGFAFLLVGAFSFCGLPMNAKNGLCWGMAGFAAFSLAPAMGLPPELPATLTAELAPRQLWWCATAAATAFGLAGLYFSRSTLGKILAALLLVLPHILGAPHGALGGPVPAELNAAFASASLGVMALFWLVLGATSGWYYGRFDSPAMK